MFAPYCETCQSRILLGPRRIVHLFSASTSGVGVTLECFCGTLVDSEARPPAPASAAWPAPRAASHQVCSVGAAS